MSKNRTGAATIPRLIAFTYNHASVGEDDKAREFWATAVARGYVPKPKMVRRFEEAVRVGWRATIHEQPLGLPSTTR